MIDSLSVKRRTRVCLQDKIVKPGLICNMLILMINKLIPALVSAQSPAMRAKRKDCKGEKRERESRR
ncbi:MAG: hypothetical protein A3H44_04795 [Gammaproteobacteria bacterium RIFCSPLOWO2_02_FULL_57_10]|nr:MAG: hypothetical protein A3H44_04795 [Gammaproteobacteria bacterium RIFCSPLOWO2_02_FULL_57_10]